MWTHEKHSTTSSSMGSRFTFNLTNADFKLDYKNVVTEFHNKDDDYSKYGVVVVDCQRIHNSIFTNSCVEFTKRLVNEAAHVLANGGYISS